MQKPNLHIAIYGNVYQTKKHLYTANILRTLQALGARISIEQRFAAFVQSNLSADLSGCHTFSTACAPEADVAISVGGDGTFLGTAAQVGPTGTPILGINTGRLGFLADVSPDVIDSSLKALFKGDYIVEERTALQVSAEGPVALAWTFALNEVAVLKHDNSSLIEIDTHVDGNYLNSYLADGLIVSTPTGSTGYSLSTGGPIVTPNLPALCISAVAPHSLSVRPVVVRDDVSVTMRVSSRSHNFMLSADGHSQSLPESTVITVRRAPFNVRVLKITHKHFFDTLRDKMLWGADQRY